MTVVEVAVVGGGMAGMTLAAEIASTCSVAVLEQEDQLGHHATGRSAATFLESYGSPEVRALTKASRPIFEMADTDAPLLTPRAMLWTAAPGHDDVLGDLLVAAPNLDRLTTAEALSLCPVLCGESVVGAAMEADARDIDVDGLLQYSTRVAMRHGATVLRSARLLSGSRRGDRWRLRHTTGGLVADVVVNAAGAWADSVATELGAAPCGLRPLRRSIAIARTPRAVESSWPLVVDAAERFYFRPEGPHVLLSPADETPSEPCDARPEETDVALAIKRINQATVLDIRNVVTAWAGLRTFAPDRNPVVGFDPDVPGLFWLAGQGGYGIQMAPALARLAASLIRSGSGPGRHRPDLGLDLDLDPAQLAPARFGPRARRPSRDA